MSPVGPIRGAGEPPPPPPPEWTEAGPAVLLRDTPEDVERLATALDADLHGYRILQSERKEWARAIVEALRRDSAES